MLDEQFHFFMVFQTELAASDSHSHSRPLDPVSEVSHRPWEEPHGMGFGWKKW
jgi:hypothetical protein